MPLLEDARVFCADIEPFVTRKKDGSPYSCGWTIYLSINGERVDRWPSIGPYERTERQALHFVDTLDWMHAFREAMTGRIGDG